jgi:hypothetical protein
MVSHLIFPIYLYIFSYISKKETSLDDRDTALTDSQLWWTSFTWPIIVVNLEKEETNGNNKIV